MEYNTINKIEDFKSLLRIIEGDAREAEQNARFEANREEMETLYRACELIEDFAGEAKILLGKMMDEREDEEEAE